MRIWLVGVTVLINRVVNQAQEKVRTDLNAAQALYRGMGFTPLGDVLISGATTGAAGVHVTSVGYTAGGREVDDATLADAQALPLPDAAARNRAQGALRAAGSFPVRHRDKTWAAGLSPVA